jgi:hypothetical protein
MKVRLVLKYETLLTVVPTHLLKLKITNSGIQTVCKGHKYCTKYLHFGFTNVDVDGEEGPQLLYVTLA